ncbi:hypothetical protein P175DRAFT_030816 [Aspergillus ochraceoroseus IBT 24754]|uniref:Uncharacterized protein n=1 Tax=Aspergillus ochraceoroseus IBT 24754 TaxID=1392256 RepID=A0A2T5M769_9EURO|nr:uncharacterized protein P175DRAFT_030816 [Aspergillus ochraceoroseus IBT 24754]PTU24364.1 hypothetical protein P175DRAFT_030816 [Aspergillus ochraceoroseus IBT 24754]
MRAFYSTKTFSTKPHASNMPIFTSSCHPRHPRLNSHSPLHKQSNSRAGLTEVGYSCSPPDPFSSSFLSSLLYLMGLKPLRFEP